MITLAGCVAACVSPERATDYRQVVECAARNPCKHGKRISNPDGVTEFCRAFGTFKIFAFIAGVSLRFTACLYSVQAFGLPSTLGRDSPPLREGLGGGSLVDVVSQLLADGYNHTRKSKAVNTRIGLVAV